MYNTLTGDFELLNNADEVFDYPEESRGSVFVVGEKLQIKGGNFRIKNIGRRFLVLEPLPGTSWEMI